MCIRDSGRLFRGGGDLHTGVCGDIYGNHRTHRDHGCILPSMLMLFDKVIINTTMGMKKKENKLYKLPEIN